MATNDNALQHLLKNQGVSRAVYDFIRHNLGERAALMAVGAAEPQSPPPPTTPSIGCRCS